MDTHDKKTTGKRNLTCGLVMPISEIAGYSATHWSEVKNIVVSSVEEIEEFTFKVELVSEGEAVGVIHKRIIENLYASDIVVCDVSGRNANVMFELGMRLAFDKPTVIIKDELTDFVFDTSVIEHLPYPSSLRYADVLVFRDHLKEKVTGTYRMSLQNPAHSTFLKSFGNFRTPTLEQSWTISEKDLSRIWDFVQNKINAETSEVRSQNNANLIKGSQTTRPINADELEKFRLYYQPIFTAEGRVVGVEALVRRKKTNGEVELPWNFMPKLIENGQMGALQKWVISTIRDDVQNLLNQNAFPGRICFNLWLQGLNSNDLDTLQDIVSSYGVKLQAEVTESDWHYNLEEAILKLLELNRRGIEIAIDDFGTGYTSLSFLNRLKIDHIKVDGSFIREITTSKDSFAIVSAIISIAHSIGCKVVAEGVETSEQVAELKKLDCDEFQGNYFGKPRELEAFQQSLRKS